MQRLTNEQGPVQEVPTPPQAAVDLEDRLREMTLRLAQAQDQQKREILRLRAQEALARAEVAARYENSMSWRLTAPLRLDHPPGTRRGRVLDSR